MNDKTPPRKRLRDGPFARKIRAALPSRQDLAGHPWLKPLANRLLDPALWHLRHEAVARGAAIGIFWAFSIPFAQFVFAAAHCVWWRGNIPVAAGATLVTNPLTLGFWLWLAYQVGGSVLDAPPPAPISGSTSIAAWLATYGGPAALGMGTFAVLGALLAYVSVKLGWRLRIWLKRRHR